MDGQLERNLPCRGKNNERHYEQKATTGAKAPQPQGFTPTKTGAGADRHPSMALVDHAPDQDHRRRGHRPDRALAMVQIVAVWSWALAPPPPGTRGQGLARGRGGVDLDVI